MRRVRQERTAGIVLLFGLVYLAFESIAAMAWVDPPYDWARNFISDLGFSNCATVDGSRICSPLHPLMNAGFLVQGVVFAVGSVLMVRIVFSSETQRRIIGIPMVLSGIGTFFVGIFHQSLALSAAGLNGLHVLAAFVAIASGNLGLILFGAFSVRSEQWRGYGIAMLAIGVIGAVSAVLLLIRVDFGLGIGLIERVAVYPLNTWTVGTAFGMLVLSARDATRVERGILPTGFAS